MIKTWEERCVEHPDHQTGMVSYAMIQARMQEEIDELRAAVFDPDWDRVKALEESLREHMAEIQRLKALRAALAQPEQEPQWDEVFDAAVRAYARSAPSREALRLCFQNKSGSDQISIGWTAQELMAFAKDIASLYTNPPQRKPLTDDEIEIAYREIWRNLSDNFSHTSAEWIEAGIRYAEKAHGIE